MMDPSNSSLVIASMNSNGSALDRRVYMKKLLTLSDILFIQEHWLSNVGLQDLQDDLDCAFVYGKSAMKDNELILGRPYGGLVIAIKRSLICNVNPLGDINCDRVYACLVKMNMCNLLLINVYLPCDDNYDERSQVEYLNALHEINLIITKMSGDVDGIVLGGDFNTDFARAASHHSSSLISFCRDNDLISCASLPCSSIDYTYQSRVAPFNVSILDHFFVSESLLQDIFSVEVLHEGDNLSDHCPLFLRLNIGCHHQQFTAKNHPPKLAWHRATEQNIVEYKQLLALLLSEIHLPHAAFQCEDPAVCTHRDELKQFSTNVNAACMAASLACIPKTKKRKVAGWTERVARFKEKSILWHRIWQQSGRPTGGLLFEIMKNAKRDYKAAVRRVMRNQNSISNTRMADALIRNDSRDFWAEVKRKACNMRPSPSVMDEVQGDEAICDLFKEKYDALYNSVQYDEADMDVLRSQVYNQAVNQCFNGSCYCDHSIRADDVSKAIRKLKKGKSGGDCAPSSDHFINAPRDLSVHLGLLFSACLLHGFLNEECLLSTLKPIPKNVKKSVQKSDNYRSIAIGSIFCKILDHIIIEKHNDVIESSMLQFGFKSKHSTVQCSFVVEETIEYFLQNESTCHALLLDATKAFDRVQFVKLFELLIKRKMCPLTVVFLISMYTSQLMNVSWNSYTSTSFAVHNGVKQGGVLSPLLFCVYIDELLCRLKSRRVGCHVGHTFAGAFGYADDLTLLAPSIGAANDMLQTCESFADEYHLKFNASKSLHLIVSKRQISPDSCISLYLNGSAIRKTENALLLGSYIGADSVSLNIKKAANDLIQKTNTVLHRFSYCDSSILFRLFGSYCTSYYGSPLLSLEHRSFSHLEVAWKKCVKRIWRVDQRTRSCYLPFITLQHDLKTQLLCRFTSFVTQCFNSANPIVNICCELAKVSSSVVAQNIRCLLSKLMLDLNCVLNSSPNSTKGRLKENYQNSMLPDTVCTGNAIRELCLVRDSTYDLNVLDHEETVALLNYLCIL